MKPLYDQKCSTSASDTIPLVAKGLKHENLISSVAKRDFLDTGDVPLDLSASYTGVTVYPCNYLASGNFLIYPNPSEGELNVEYFDEKEDSSLEENNFTEGVFQIELYDKQEKLVRTAESKSGKVNLETNNMQPGTYFLQIRTGKEVFRKQILIK